MFKQSKNRLMTGVALSVFAFAGGAMAQSAGGQTGALEEIVVTATKRPSVAQRTPIAMSVVGQGEMARAGITSLNDLSNVAPTLNIAQNNANTLITIRGVSSRDYTETGDPAVAVSIDNFYLQRSVGLNAAIFDVERVEVLRGPQGTLYGRNATAGAVNISTVKPGDELEGRASLELGNYDTINAEAAITVPVSDKVSVRAAGVIRDNKGYRNNIIQRGDETDVVAGRLHVKVDPTDRLSILLTGEIIDVSGTGPVIKGVPYSDVNADGTLQFGSRKRWELNNEGYTDIETKTLRWKFDYDLDDVTLTYLGGYRDMSFNRDNDQDGGTLFNYGFQQNEDVETQNHEVRLTTNNTGPFNFQVGAYYFREVDDLLTFFQVNGLGPDPFNFYTFDYETKSESLAGFAQVNYDITDEVQAEVGIRYTEDDKSQVGQNDIAAGFFSPVNNTYSDNEVTWHLGLNWEPTADNFIYAKVDRGYKAGGYTTTTLFGPETITAYEIGAKNRFMDNSLQLNVSAFYYDYTDLQVQQNDPVTAISQIYNAGAATVKGGEIEVVYQPTVLDRIDASIAFVDAEFDRFCTVTTDPCPAGNDFSGNTLPQAPKWSLSGGISHDFIFGESILTARVQSRFQSRSYFSFINRPQEQQTSYTKTDIIVTYTQEGWPVEISAYGRNIENSRILTTSEEAGYAGGYLVQYAAPATYGVRLNVTF